MICGRISEAREVYQTFRASNHNPNLSHRYAAMAERNTTPELSNKATRANNCPVCGSSVPESKGNKPRKYCSESCKVKSSILTRKIRYKEDEEFRRSILDSNKAYFQTDAGKSAVTRASSAWKSNNFDKRKAHNKVLTAIRAGRLVKSIACECCGSKEPLDAHHDDYSAPLDVRWLCRRCHHAVHNHLVA